VCVAWNSLYIQQSLTVTFYSVSRDSSDARQEIIDLKQQLHDAEEHRLTDLEHAEARLAADLQAAEEHRLTDLERAEAAAEARRLRHLERAETAAEARRLADLERTEKCVREVEELFGSILSIILHWPFLPLPLTSVSSAKRPEIPSPRR
jgi:exonuclease VII large subunit